LKVVAPTVIGAIVLGLVAFVGVGAIDTEAPSSARNHKCSRNQS